MVKNIFNAVSVAIVKANIMLLSNRFQTHDFQNYTPLPVAYEIRASILEKIKNKKDPLPNIQGRYKTKRDVLRALLSGHSLYLISEEGTGKTRLAKAITGLLGPIPKIKGCMYNDDPKWPANFLCSRCKEEINPAERFGIEIICGENRFSRIQGNDYTDEAKLIGVKDIQAILDGKSPDDITTFSATGAFRANRGILFIDEMPAIRTKVQVLIHPMIEEKMVVLEEYNWEHHLDVILIATGNPQGFSHVNEVPRPLLDRLELVYVPLPCQKIEREIMLEERFKISKNYFEEKKVENKNPVIINFEDIQRDVIIPWWILYLLNEAIAFSRKCSLIDRKPSLRAGNKAIDHTFAGAEIDSRKVANLKDACEGLQLTMRGRIGLRADLIDYENPGVNYMHTDELSEDLLFNALDNSADMFLQGCDRNRLVNDLKMIAKEENYCSCSILSKYKELNNAVKRLYLETENKIESRFLTSRENLIFSNPDKLGNIIRMQLNFSAIETIANVCLNRDLVNSKHVEKRFFIPKMVTWAKGG